LIGNEAEAESGSFASEITQEALLVLPFIGVLTELNELLSSRKHAEVDGRYFTGGSCDGLWSTSSRSDSSIESAERGLGIADSARGEAKEFCSTTGAHWGGPAKDSTSGLLIIRCES
jgi:hypothetical protein